MSWGVQMSGFADTIQLLDQVRLRWGEDVTWVVGPTAHYGIYVELGTSRQKPQPYLEPAVRSVIAEAERLTKSVDDGSAEAVKILAFEIERRAKKNAPVDTGNLRASITAERVK